MSCERLYFIAAGRSLELIEQANEKRKAAAEARWDYATSIGGVGVFGSDEHFTGVVFKPGTKPAAPGWKHNWRLDGQGNDIYVPDLRTKAGKALRLLLGSDQFDKPTSKDIFSGGWHCSGMYMHYPTVERVGGKMIISIPKMDKEQFVPADAIPIKTSEYFRLKEEEAAAAEKRDGEPAAA